MKTYINITPAVNGAHSDQANSFFEVEGIPEGWIEVPEELVPIWKQYAPFVALTIEDGKLTGISDNPEARAAQQAAGAGTDASAPVDLLTQIQLAIAELAEAQAADQTATELALAELAELIMGGVN